MINQTEAHNRHVAHTARIARVNRDGWIYEASRTTRGGSTPVVSRVISRIRQTIRTAVVQAGGRLQGSPAGDPVNPAETGYTLDGAQ
jgi:hypothetical protein